MQQTADNNLIVLARKFENRTGDNYKFLGPLAVAAASLICILYQLVLCGFQDRISPILPIIGTRCSWCVSAGGTAMLSLVQTRIGDWISAGTLKRYINTAKTQLTQAYYPYVSNMWVANLSTTVSGWQVSTYNSRMSSVGSNLALVDARLNSALNDAREAVGIIDDLLDLAWTQKARPIYLLIRAFH